MIDRLNFFYKRISTSFSIKKKFALLVLLFGGFSFIFVYQSYSTLKEKTVLKIEKNISGIQRIHGVKQLVLLLQEHRGAWNGLHQGEKSFQAIHQEMDQNLKEFLPQLKEKIQKSPKVIQGGFHGIEKAIYQLHESLDNKTPEQGFHIHTFLISKSLAFIRLIKAHYQMASNQDLQTLVLVDIYSNQLPALSELLGQLRGIGSGELARKGKRERSQIFSLIKSIDDERILTEEHMSTIVLMNKNTSILDELKKGHEEILSYINLSREIFSSKSPSYSSRLFFYKGTQVINKLNRISEITKNSLENRMNILLAQGNQYRWRSLIQLVAAIFIFLVIVILISRSILKPINDLSQVALLIKSGKYPEPVQTSGKDEISELRNNFFNMMNTIKEREEELNQFAYRTSHDLKSPLMSIRGFSELIERDIQLKKYEKIGGKIARIQAMTNKLEVFISDILNLTKRESFQKIESFNIESALEEIKEEEFSIQNKVDFLYTCNHKVPLKCNSVRLKQVLNNLIRNAILYSNPEREKRFVKVQTESRDEKFIIEVSDNGLGIPSDKYDEIFSMSSRFHQNSSNGSGIGLYLVKKHIDKMGGDIGVSSNEDGSTFTIQLPTDIDHNA